MYGLVKLHAEMNELAQYDYDLPRHLIAQEPLTSRADARLLVVARKERSIEHYHVRDLPELLRAGDCLVLNDTRVVPARLVGRRDRTGGHWEGLFLEGASHAGTWGKFPTCQAAQPTQGALETGPSPGKLETGPTVWRILCKARGRLVPDERITLLAANGQEDVGLHMGAKQPDGSWIVRPETTQETFALLERVGRVPLPPYIRKGEMGPADREHYQTVYARQPGAVAAPTAGLHFTESLLRRLGDAGIEICKLTLHVGPGTFRPIASQTLAEHKLDAEWGTISQTAVDHITACRQRGGRCVAVGTTSVRVLETAAAGGELKPLAGHTDLFIRPPFSFHVVDALMTNFHLPRTTLLVLVRTFGGDGLIHRAYQEAIREQYRFYSYGDAMLVL
jgi:S-adenosylmethionine:tRNA ribosyltransferase-isomerase